MFAILVLQTKYYQAALKDNLPRPWALKFKKQKKPCRHAVARDTIDRRIKAFTDKSKPEGSDYQNLKFETLKRLSFAFLFHGNDRIKFRRRFALSDQS